MLSDPNVGFEKSDPNQAYKRALYRGCGFRTKDLSQPIIAIVDYLSTSRKKKIDDAIKENKIPLRTPDFHFSPEERYEVHPYMRFSVLLSIPEIIKFSPFDIETP